MSRARAGACSCSVGCDMGAGLRSEQLVPQLVLRSATGHITQLKCMCLPKGLGLSLATSLSWIESGKVQLQDDLDQVICPKENKLLCLHGFITKEVVRICSEGWDCSF